jgi:O-antigen ligase
MTTIRVGLCVVVAFAVFAHGAVEPWSESILQISAALLFLWWAVLAFQSDRLEVRGNLLLLALLGFVLWVLVQWVFGLSVYAYLTKTAALKWAAFFLLAFLFLQAYRSVEHLRGLIWFLLILGFVVALFGIIQHHTFNGKLYWLRELRSGGVPFGPYVNRNHFAGLMELLVPTGLALLFLRGVRRDRLALVGLFTVIPIGALFLSASRGGIVAFVFEVVLLGLLVWVRPAGRKSLAFSTVVVLAVAAFLIWLDVGKAFERFVQTPAEELTRGRRVEMVQDTWRIFRDHPVKGIGAGTLVAVFPRYETLYDGKVVDHAHNDHVEFLAETGVIGGVFGLAFLVLLYVRALRRMEDSSGMFLLGVRIGSLVACSGLLIHGLVDFNLQIPSNALLFFLLAAVAAGDFQAPNSPGTRLEQPQVVFSA